jgi:hypothetical protein
MADEPGVSDAEADAAFERVRAAFSERSKLIARKTKRSVCLFAASLIVSSMFLKEMPLHPWFYPSEQIVLVFCGLAFALAGFDATVFIGDWFDRRKLDRIH